MPDPTATSPAGAAPLRLHVGSGPERLEGWVNVDRQELPGVDLVADVTGGLPLQDGSAEAVFAEHFLEHLRLDHAIAFLHEAHRVLAPGGWLRLTTPNLEWVVATHYLDRSSDPASQALGLNLGFHGWSHRFLWNRALLGEALEACGFEAPAWQSPGVSQQPLLRGLERHQQYPDTPQLPHVLVAEARRGAHRPALLAALRRRLEEVLQVLRPLAHRVDEERSRATVRLPVRGALGRVAGDLLLTVPVRGHLRLPPEAPGEAEVSLAADLAGIRPVVPHRGAPGGGRLASGLRRRLAGRLAAQVAATGVTVSFRSTGVSVRDPLHLRVRGVLGWQGQAREVACDMALRHDGDACHARATFDLHRSDFGSPLPGEGPGLLRVADEARLEVELVATACYPT
jgi:predicted SAM-dependent methyltransferase